MTLLVYGMCACVYFPFIIRHNKSAYSLFGERARENKRTVLRKQANVGDVRRIGRLTGMFVCPSVRGLYYGNVIRVSQNRQHREENTVLFGDAASC